MKAMLTLFLLVSVTINIILLSGCASVSGTAVSAPEAFSGDKLEWIRSGIPDEDKTQFDAINSYVASQRGKAVVVIAPGELEDHETVLLFIQK